MAMAIDEETPDCAGTFPVLFQYFSVLLHVYSSRKFQYQFYGILNWNSTGIWDMIPV
jgi:hypothetical protein